MLLPPRPTLLLLWTGLGSFVPGSRCGSPRHSLCHSYLKVSEPSQGLPQFFFVLLLDDQPIARYDDRTSWMEPLVPWMGAEEATTLVGPERIFRADLEWLSKLSHQTEGLHTWQAILGCEDGSKGGFLHYGYDGMDFISFDKETLRWVIAQPQAQKVKEKWEEDPRRSQRNKVYLEKLCIQKMQEYLSYQKEALKKTATWWRILVGIGAATILGAGILFLIGLWRRQRKNIYQEVRTFHLPQILLSPSTDGPEDEMPSQRLPLTEITSEVNLNFKKQNSGLGIYLRTKTIRVVGHKASNGLQRTWSDPEITASSLCRQEGKEHPVWKTWTHYPEVKTRIRLTLSLNQLNPSKTTKDPAAPEGKPGFIYNIHCKDFKSQCVG